MTFHDANARFSASRRRFMQGLACGGVAAGLGLARPSFGADDGIASSRAVLSGSEFDLTIGELRVNFTGATRRATVVNGQLPAPLLRWRQGDTVTLRVRNTLPVRSSIHWHGIVLPADMDGVPGLSFMGIAPGETYTYRFTVNQSGTYWYHSHSRFQEQIGLYGPIVVEPCERERFPADREHVVLLSDWTDADPERIYATLKKQSNYYNYGKPTAGDFLRDVSEEGVKAALASRRMWNQTRMDPSDLADVSAATYTYLMNGATPARNWTALFARIDEFRIGPAETYDVIVQPSDDRAYAIFAQAMDRSGYARGTLAPREGVEATVPPLDPRPLLTMRDMMGDMGGGAMAGMDMSGDAMSGVHHGTTQGEMDSPHHAAAEYGPGVDMHVDAPRTNLDDPGVGLRDNGRRALTYADVHTIGAPISADTSREIELHLTGHMERYVWSFNGQKFSDAEPLRLALGERVRFVLVNDTMMTHPIHLHGMWSELETPDGEFLARKHTLVVQPAQKVSYRVSADAVGRWAYHCHLLYHMEAGMFREVVVA
jgi:FtsP/CotA-like multicopper oxidase with cupredoxin domain